jgi:5'-nucleotidase
MFLLSNDDGVHAQGLAALAEAVAPLGEVLVVAPDREQSAASHAISLHRPLRVGAVREGWWEVDGTPTDCVYLGLHHLAAGRRPALVLSGINRGANLGDDVNYSGTVAAAMEGALSGVPAVAFSLVSPSRAFAFAPAVPFVRALVRSLLANPLPDGALLNVNLPEGPIRGYTWTRMGKRSYGQLVEERKDPRGRTYFWIGGTEKDHQDLPGSDCNAVYDQQVASITPLHLDLTHHRLLDELRPLPVEGYVAS